MNCEHCFIFVTVISFAEANFPEFWQIFTSKKLISLSRVQWHMKCNYHLQEVLMSNQSKKILVTGLFGLALFAGGCAARTGPIRGESTVEGDSMSTSGRGQLNSGTQS
jgi:hypothetical protein